jgi:hypothetical protein
MGSTRNILASLGLWCWQHMIVRGLYEHCIAAEYICCRKTILIPRISYVHQILQFLSNCVEHNFLSKSRFLWQSTRLRIRGLAVLQYIQLRLFFFPCPAACGIFQILFMWQRRRYTYCSALTAYRKRSADNIKRFVEKCFTVSNI